ncbi:MAG: hypothetical protein ACI85I_001310 [Arenicella sp.]|jgi:hypothetical protein
MIMNKNYLYLFAFLFFISCTSGKNDFESGNYEAAVAKSVNRLRSNSKNKNARETLARAYPLALKYLTTQVQNQKSSANQFKWESVLTNYNKLNAMYEDILRCPACVSIVSTPKNYLPEAEEARRNAAEARYELGMRLLETRTRIDAKKAYTHFRKVESILQNYKDTRQKTQDAINLATLKVVVDKVPNYAYNSSISTQYFSDKMDEFFTRNPKMGEFVRFYTTQSAGNSAFDRPNEVVRMQFDNFNVGQERRQERVEDFVQDSVIVGQVDVNGESKNVYGTVKAKLFSYEKTVSITGKLHLEILETNSSRTILQEDLQNEYIWKSEWAIYQGDERALSAEQLRRTQVREVQLPNQQDLFVEFSRPIFEQATSRIQNYYRNK